MQPYLEFALRHWELCLAFIVVLVLLLGLELRVKLSGLAQLTPNEAILLINRDEAIVVDIRDSAQFAKGHILGAINIPSSELATKTNQLEKYRDKTIILVHSTTQPPGKAGVTLQENGFLNVKNLTGGINAWLDANLPLVKN